jgi:quercetin dioxygenase-like cupin family protein
MTPRRSRILAALAAALMAGGGATVGWAAGAGEPEPVVREPLAATKHARGVEGRELGLSRVTVMPGAELPVHTHPGTQVAYVEQGTLTYTVVEGRVRVMRGSSDDPAVVRTIGAGESGRVRTGQWLVEQPNDVHQGANRGDVPVVIFTATLLRNGKPAAIPH